MLIVGNKIIERGYGVGLDEVLDVGTDVVGSTQDIFSSIQDIPVIGDIVNFLGDIWESGGKDIFLDWVRQEVLGKKKEKGGQGSVYLRLGGIPQQQFVHPAYYPPMYQQPTPVVITTPSTQQQDNTSRMLLQYLLAKEMMKGSGGFELKPEYILLGIGLLGLILALTTD